MGKMCIVGVQKIKPVMIKRKAKVRQTLDSHVSWILTCWAPKGLNNYYKIQIFPVVGVMGCSPKGY